MKTAKNMFIGVLVLAVIGGALAYKLKSDSPAYICYTTDLSEDSHTCNLVYSDAFTVSIDSMRVYYTITGDTVACKKGIPCDSLTVLPTP